MLDGKKVFVIIGAAGSGKRMGAPVPKQFLKINGKTILEETVQKFRDSSVVDDITVVTAAEYVSLCEKLFCGGGVSVVAGGKERQDSIGNALDSLAGRGVSDDDIVLVHDGVRPYCSQELIQRVAKDATEKGAVIAAVPPKDTIRHIDEGTLDRSKLYNVQTPQGFKASILQKAYGKAKEDGFYGTDDAGLVERIGISVSVTEGENTNIKITTPEDLKMENRIGTGFDVHRLTEGRKLILGGVDIPFEKGLDGHSDADVLVHALMDALLGACAMGDIGKLFPDTDDSFKGISSLKLMKKVREVLTERGFTLVNCDMTLICQRPKLAPYIDQMRQNIADVLETDVNRVSIKATTTEKLGFAGRGEGICCEAVALLQCRGC